MYEKAMQKHLKECHAKVRTEKRVTNSMDMTTKKKKRKEQKQKQKFGDCAICGKTVRNLAEHKKAHLLSLGWLCTEPNCDVRLPSRLKLERHVNIVHKKGRKVPAGVDKGQNGIGDVGAVVAVDEEGMEERDQVEVEETLSDPSLLMDKTEQLLVMKDEEEDDTGVDGSDQIDELNDIQEEESVNIGNGLGAGVVEDLMDSKVEEPETKEEDEVNGDRGKETRVRDNPLMVDMDAVPSATQSTTTEQNGRNIQGDEMEVDGYND